MPGEKNSRKGKPRNKCRQIIIGLKKLKLQKREKKKTEEERKKGKKGKLHTTAKAQCRGEVYNNNRKCD